MADGDCVSVCERVNAPCCFCSKKKSKSQILTRKQNGAFSLLFCHLGILLFLCCILPKIEHLYLARCKKKEEENQKCLQVKQAHPLRIWGSYLKPGRLSGDNICVKILVRQKFQLHFSKWFVCCNFWLISTVV